MRRNWGASRVVDLGELRRPEIWIPVVEVRVWIGGVGFFKEIGRILQDLFYLSNIQYYIISSIKKLN